MKEKIKKLFEQIKTANNILISAHIAPDGDAVGSSFGLALIIKELGKNVKVIKNDDYPSNLEFIYRDDLYYNDEFEDIDLFIAVDSADKQRIGESQEYFDKAKDTAVIDHHITNEGYSNNDIIYFSSSASEMVADIFINGGYKITKEAANYLYLGILTDTYRFQYDSADDKTFEIAAKLFRLGAEKKLIQEELFETLDPNLLFMQVEVIKNAKRIGDKIITAKITKELLDKYNLDFAKTESLVSLLKTIKGIEVSAIAKEENENESKFSFRSQKYVDVSKIATEFGGGGHVRASGATYYSNIDDAYEKLNERLERLNAQGDFGNK